MRNLTLQHSRRCFSLILPAASSMIDFRSFKLPGVFHNKFTPKLSTTRCLKELNLDCVVDKHGASVGHQIRQPKTQETFWIMQRFSILMKLKYFFSDESEFTDESKKCQQMQISVWVHGFIFTEPEIWLNCSIDHYCLGHKLCTFAPSKPPPDKLLWNLLFIGFKKCKFPLLNLMFQPFNITLYFSNIFFLFFSI